MEKGDSSSIGAKPKGQRPQPQAQAGRNQNEPPVEDAGGVYMQDADFFGFSYTYKSI